MSTQAVTASSTRASAWSGLAAPWVRWLALLFLCAAYLQGGIDKLVDFDAAVAEMSHFGLSPAAPLAAAVIALELGCSLLVLTGRLRWLGALALAGFTLMATFVANRFWELPMLQNRLRVQPQWLWSYFTGQRSSRFIPESPRAPGVEAT